MLVALRTNIVHDRWVFVRFRSYLGSADVEGEGCGSWLTIERARASTSREISCRAWPKASATGMSYGLGVPCMDRTEKAAATALPIRPRPAMILMPLDEGGVLSRTEDVPRRARP